MTSELKPCASDVVQITKHDRPITMKDIEEFDGGCMNTRAVPDVPELVRYDKGDICLAIENGYDPLPSKDGEYVTYSQAAEIIAALKADLHDMREQRDRAMGWRDHDKERAEAAEAKLAQYEAQDPVAWVDENGMAAFTLGGISKVHTQFETSKSERFCFPLYASPAPAADLRAENERLREALKPFAEYMHTDEGRLDLDNLGNELPDNDHVGWLYLNHKDFRAARAALNVEASNDKA